MRAAFLISLALGLSACGEAWEDNRIAFGGIYFGADVAAQDDKPEVFTLVIKDANQNIEAAREAGRYEGTKYCVEFFGTSDIAWGQGPDQTPNVVKGDLYLNGSCSV